MSSPSNTPEETTSQFLEALSAAIVAINHRNGAKAFQYLEKAVTFTKEMPLTLIPAIQNILDVTSDATRRIWGNYPVNLLLPEHKNSDTDRLFNYLTQLAEEIKALKQADTLVSLSTSDAPTARLQKASVALTDAMEEHVCNNQYDLLSVPAVTATAQPTVDNARSQSNGRPQDAGYMKVDGVLSGLKTHLLNNTEDSAKLDKLQKIIAEKIQARDVQAAQRAAERSQQPGPLENPIYTEWTPTNTAATSGYSKLAADNRQSPQYEEPHLYDRLKRPAASPHSNTVSYRALIVQLRDLRKTIISPEHSHPRGQSQPRFFTQQSSVSNDATTALNQWVDSAVNMLENVPYLAKENETHQKQISNILNNIHDQINKVRPDHQSSINTSLDQFLEIFQRAMNHVVRECQNNIILPSNTRLAKENLYEAIDMPVFENTVSRDRYQQTLVCQVQTTATRSTPLAYTAIFTEYHAKATIEKVDDQTQQLTAAALLKEINGKQGTNHTAQDFIKLVIDKMELMRANSSPTSPIVIRVAPKAGQDFGEAYITVAKLYAAYQGYNVEVSPRFNNVTIDSSKSVAFQKYIQSHQLTNHHCPSTKQLEESLKNQDPATSLAAQRPRGNG